MDNVLASVRQVGVESKNRAHGTSTVGSHVDIRCGEHGRGNGLKKRERKQERKR